MHGYTLDRAYGESWHKVIMQSWLHQATTLYCLSTWENIKLVPKLAMTLTYEWDHKVIIYSLQIESLLMETNRNRYTP